MFSHNGATGPESKDNIVYLSLQTCIEAIELMIINQVCRAGW